MVRVRLTKVQTSTRRHHVWLEVWTNLSNEAQKREKEDWANERPKLENARRKRGIYFIAPEGKEHEETIKKCEEQVGSADGSCHAAQEEEPKPFVLAGNCSSSWSTRQRSKDKVRLYSGISRIHETANGTNFAKRSRRSHRMQGIQIL